MRVPVPISSPRSTTLAETGPKTSSSWSRPGPLARTVSLPSSAGLRVPSTGPSTSRSPSLAIQSTPTVLACHQIWSSRRLTPSITCATVGPSASIVTTTSAPVDGLGRGPGDGRAESLRLLARAVPDDDVVASGEVARHRRAHDPRAEDGDSQNRNTAPMPPSGTRSSW